MKGRKFAGVFSLICMVWMFTGSAEAQVINYRAIFGLYDCCGDQPIKFKAFDYEGDCPTLMEVTIDHESTIYDTSAYCAKMQLEDVGLDEDPFSVLNISDSNGQIQYKVREQSPREYELMVKTVGNQDSEHAGIIVLKHAEGMSLNNISPGLIVTIEYIVCQLKEAIEMRMCISIAALVCGPKDIKSISYRSNGCYTPGTCGYQCR